MIDESERMMILNATRTMDDNQKKIYYEQKKKSEGLMAVLSFIIPGLGQMLMGRIGRGLVILFLSWLIIPWIYGIYDAHKIAKEYNQELYNLMFGAHYQQPQYQQPSQPPQPYQQQPPQQQPPQQGYYQQPPQPQQPNQQQNNDPYRTK